MMIYCNYGCIITGTPEYGKTYTAINLLWGSYKNSNYTKYVEKSPECTNEVISKLVKHDKSLASHFQISST